MKKLIICLISIFIIFPLYAQNINVVINEQNKLIEDVKNEFISITSMIDTLKEKNNLLIEDNKQMTVLCEQSMDKILKLEENISTLKQALYSNKEDTSIVIEELGFMVEELQKYKEYISMIERKLKNSCIFTNIAIPLTTIPLIAFGTYNMLEGDELLGKTSLYTGLVLFVSLEVVYQGGKFIFKLW